MLNSNSNNQEMKSSYSGKNNQISQFLHKAGVEFGAWILTGGFFFSMAWLAENIF